MIYRLLKSWLLAVLRAPAEPPPAPAGSPGSERTFRAAPRFLVYHLVVNWLAMLIPTVFFGAAAAASSSPWPLLFLGLSLMGALTRHFLIRLDYDLRYYIVTDRSLRIRSGALIIDESTYTFANIQNLVIHQGPLERMMGIANLEVQTAGGGALATAAQQQGALGGHRSVLAGIDNAEEVRNLILELLKKFKDAGLGDPEDARRAGEAPRASSGGFSAAAIGRLREILVEAKALNA